jgi:hypothetical protein
VTATNFGGFKERLIKAYGGDESKVPWPQGVHTVEEGAKNGMLPW